MTPGIEVDNVSFAYPGCRQKSLSSVSISLPASQCTGLIGPNGAGKSTLLSILSGLLKANQGTVSFADSEEQSNDTFIQHNVALVPQEYAFYEQLTTLQNLQYFASLCTKTKLDARQMVNEVLTQCQLEDEKGRQARFLSGGYKRRLNLAIALLKKPEILYLDEPTVGVDPVSRETILTLINTLKEQGKTIVFTSHMLHEVQSICDQIVMLNEGRALQISYTNKSKLLDVEVSSKLAPKFTEKLNNMTKCKFSDELSFQCEIESDQQLFDIFGLMAESECLVHNVHYGPESLTHQYMTMLENSDSTKY